jgi:hypothetical protein
MLSNKKMVEMSKTKATFNPPFPLITKPYAIKGPAGVLIWYKLVPFDLVIGCTLDPGCQKYKECTLTWL